MGSPFTAFALLSVYRKLALFIAFAPPTMHEGSLTWA
jgi:hypothetical protein